MTRLSPQQYKLLITLREAGPRGVHSLTCREKLRIGDPSRRTIDLMRLGCEINRKPERWGRTNGTRYTLISEPAELGAATFDQTGVAALAVPAVPTRRASYGERLAKFQEERRGCDVEATAGGDLDEPSLFASAPQTLSAITGKPIEKAV